MPQKELPNFKIGMYPAVSSGGFIVVREKESLLEQVYHSIIRIAPPDDGMALIQQLPAPLNDPRTWTFEDEPNKERNECERRPIIPVGWQLRKVITTITVIDE